MGQHLPTVSLGPGQKRVDTFWGDQNGATYRERSTLREQVVAYLVGVGNGGKPVGGKI